VKPSPAPENTSPPTTVRTTSRQVEKVGVPVRNWPTSERGTAHTSRPAAVPGSFKACVLQRESGGGTGGSNLYGILTPAWRALGLPGDAWHASAALQSQAFDMQYARYGVGAWRPWDGC
jgi:hypothetical protein